MSEFNIERLREAVAWAEAEAAKPPAESRWHQPAWAKRAIEKAWRKREVLTDGEASDWRVVPVDCGTAFCVAGHVCATQRDVFVMDEGDYGWHRRKSSPAVVDYVIPRGKRRPITIENRARKLLGISFDEADMLFDGFNSIDDVRRIARIIARAHGETL